MGRGRAPCCDKSKVRTGPWSPAEDLRLINFIQKHGHSNWRALPKQAGLLRCGKSCRLRWVNYLRPDVKRGNFTPEEEQTIIKLHNSIGNKWSKIASYLPGRTDNEIKNVWNTHLKKRLSRKSAVDCHKAEAKDSKMDYSASSSCTSSSTTTSGDENMEKLLGDQGVQDSEVKKPNEKPEEFLKVISTHPSDNEPKETAASDHSPSSYSCVFNFSNSSPDNRPKQELGYSKSEATNPQDGLDNGKTEIPSDFDIGFWELMDSLDPLQSNKAEQNGGEQDTNLSISDSEVEFSKWLRFLENELGLTSDGDHLPKDQNLVTATPHNQEMSFQPEISPALDYFPIWPCSPQYLGI
ncbi:hypothetical protein Pfo_013345 [Paulownia fortunei]|nr:hypothetical protein Pfo_013345 [Paulownia fortunei]